jgi:hypothetical protein
MLAGDVGCHVLAVGDISDHHARALRRQRPRIVPADALGPAGDDRGFSFKPCHSLLPAIHAFMVGSCKTWMPATSAGMTWGEWHAN